MHGAFLVDAVDLKNRLQAALLPGVSTEGSDTTA